MLLMETQGFAHDFACRAVKSGLQFLLHVLRQFRRQGHVHESLHGSDAMISIFDKVGHSSGQRLAQRRSRGRRGERQGRSEEHTSELQSLMRISYAVFCLKKKTTVKNAPPDYTHLIKQTITIT